MHHVTGGERTYFGPGVDSQGPLVVDADGAPADCAVGEFDTHPLAQGDQVARVVLGQLTSTVGRVEECSTSIERVEGDTETHVMLVTGTNYVVLESVDEVVTLHREDRARVQALAGFQLAAAGSSSESSSTLPLRLLEPVAHHDSGGEG